MAFKYEKPPQYLVFDKEWDTHRNSGEFDYVVVGSSFCAIGFVYQLLLNNHNAKIFIIERGDFPERFHSFTPTELGKKEKSTEEFPWNFSTCKDGHVSRVRGMNYFFGGRSSFWKAWCPKPTGEEMAEWPDEVIERVHKYFPKAESLLSVEPANEHFNQLQTIIFKKLKSIYLKVETLTRIEPAPLAIVQDQSSKYGRKKYSVLKPLQEILENNINVKAVTGCLVKRIHHEEGRVKFLETNKGDFNLGRAKLILAMSTLPSTTLMLNSFPCMRSIGKRFTAHFASYIYARVPMYDEKLTAERLEMAAVYIAGENKESKHQFHIQLNAVAIRKENSLQDIEEMRNLLKAPKVCQLERCENSIVFICASLGQLDHDNQHNKFYLDHTHTSTDTDITRNATLHCEVNDRDKALWTTMDDTSFKILEFLSPTKIIEYWNSETNLWETNRPPTQQIRSRDLVHPASTMWIGRDTESQESPVNLDYKFRGIENVYLTGGALWPTGASWNPTCTMTAMAMDLGDRLSRKQLKKEEHLSNAVDSSTRTERPPNLLISY